MHSLRQLSGHQRWALCALLLIAACSRDHAPASRPSPYDGEVAEPVGADEADAGEPTQDAVSVDIDPVPPMDSGPGAARELDAGARPVRDAAAPSLDASKEAGPQDAMPPLDAEPEEEGGISVRGRLIGPNGMALPDWPVAYKSKLVRTDADGHFAFDHVQTPYDLAFSSAGRAGTTFLPELWLFRDLTRPDPTLQADVVVGPNERDLSIERLNMPEPPAPDAGQEWVTEFAVAFGSAQAEASGGGGRGPGTLVLGGVSWFGASTLPGTFHALGWVQPRRAPYYGLQNVYVSYRETPVVISALSSSSDGWQTLSGDFTPNDVALKPFRVRVEANWGGSDVPTTVTGAIVFDSHAALSQFNTEIAPGEEREFALPDLPRSKLVVVAKRGGFDQTFGVAHRQVGASDATLLLDIPAYRTLLEPDDEASVHESTPFRWSEGVGAVAVLRLECPDTRYQVISARPAETWPTSKALGFAFPRNVECRWLVQIDGAYATTDDAAHPDGMVDPMHIPGRHHRGTPSRDGTMTRSTYRTIQTAP